MANQYKNKIIYGGNVLTSPSKMCGHHSIL